jgi:flagellar protein FlgJ
MALAGPDAAQALAIDAKALSNLKREAHAAPEQALSKAAGQFEAMFLQMVLKQMRETLPKDGPLASDTMRTYTSMFDQQIAQHLSSRGLGLREAIERQLGRALQPKPATGEGGNPPAPAATPGPSAKEALRRIGAAPATPLPAHAAAPAAGGAGPSSRVQAFVEQLRPHAEAAARASGIPAHLLIAQAGLETGWGRSQPRNADGSASHNLMGVKATGGWKGASVAASTTEFVQGVAVRAVEKFRSYASLTESLRDFARLLGSDRYAAARASARANDGDGYARHLQRAGYATDPRYAEKLGAAIRMVSRQIGDGPAQVAAAAPSAAGPDRIQVPAAGADNPVERTAT